MGEHSCFDMWEGWWGGLTRNNPYAGQLHYTPNSQFHLYMKVDADADEVLVARIIYNHDEAEFSFYDSNTDLIGSVSEFDYGLSTFEFIQVGEYFKKPVS